MAVAGPAVGDASALPVSASATVPLEAEAVSSTPQGCVVPTGEDEYVGVDGASTVSAEAPADETQAYGERRTGAPDRIGEGLLPRGRYPLGARERRRLIRGGRVRIQRGRRRHACCDCRGETGFRGQDVRGRPLATHGCTREARRGDLGRPGVADCVDRRGRCRRSRQGDRVAGRHVRRPARPGEIRAASPPGHCDRRRRDHSRRDRLCGREPAAAGGEGRRYSRRRGGLLRL